MWTQQKFYRKTQLQLYIVTKINWNNHEESYIVFDIWMSDVELPILSKMKDQFEIKPMCIMFISSLKIFSRNNFIRTTKNPSEHHTKASPYWILTHPVEKRQHKSTLTIQTASDNGVQLIPRYKLSFSSSFQLVSHLASHSGVCVSSSWRLIIVAHRCMSARQECVLRCVRDYSRIDLYDCSTSRSSLRFVYVCVKWIDTMRRWRCLTFNFPCGVHLFLWKEGKY